MATKIVSTTLDLIMGCILKRPHTHTTTETAVSKQRIRFELKVEKCLQVCWHRMNGACTIKSNYSIRCKERKWFALFYFSSSIYSSTVVVVVAIEMAPFSFHTHRTVDLQIISYHTPIHFCHKYIPQITLSVRANNTIHRFVWYSGWRKALAKINRGRDKE